MKWIFALVVIVSCGKSSKDEDSKNALLGKSIKAIENYGPQKELEFLRRQGACKTNSKKRQKALNPLSYKEGNTYQIYTAEQLRKIAQDPKLLKLDFKLMTHIDLKKVPAFTIGTRRNAFTGSFDGQFCEIKNFNFSKAQKNRNAGALFSYTHKATLKNIALKNSFVDAVVSGALVAYASQTTFENILVLDSTIIGEKAAGGIIGAASDSLLSSFSISNSRITSSSFAGGLVGRMISLKEELRAKLSFFSHYRTSVQGRVGVGGVFGSTQEAIIEEGFSNGDVSGLDLVGGVIGVGDNSSLSRVIGVSGFSNLGENLGYLLGEEEGGSLNQVYYNGKVDCLLCAIDERSIPIKNTEDLFRQNSELYEGWDFQSVWGFDLKSGPYLLYKSGVRYY